MPDKWARHGMRIIGVLAIGGLAAAAVVLAMRPTTKPLIGMVRATEIKVQPEVSGRISAILVRAGDQVRVGDVVAKLSNPELAASVEEARAAVVEAKATRDRVYAGVRQEQVDAASEEVEKAQADLTLAKQYYKRKSALAKRDDASKQDLDESHGSLSTAQANLKLAQAQLDKARRGPTAEDRGISDATVTAAEASLTVLERRLEKLQLKAPVDGIVQVVIGELGEATVPERTVLTITDADGLWFNFNIREDQLLGIGIGKSLTLTEGSSGKRIAAKVSEVRPLGNFATWRAAHAVGDHDLNVFAVRADPSDMPENLEPGITVWLTSVQ